MRVAVTMKLSKLDLTIDANFVISIEAVTKFCLVSLYTHNVAFSRGEDSLWTHYMDTFFFSN